MNKLTVSATRADYSTSPIKFKHPITGDFVTGVLVTGTSNRYQVVMSDIAAATYSLFECELDGARFVFNNPVTVVGADAGMDGFSFLLPTGGKASVGIKKGTSLVRTLYSQEQLNAGAIYWDGRDDAGNVVADAATCTVVVESNQLTVTWNGAHIGNTSADKVGLATHHAFQGMYGMACAGDHVYYCCNYYEGRNSTFKFHKDDVQHKLDVAYKPTNAQGTTHVATDGVNVYWAGFDSLAGWNTFVFATKCADDMETAFAQGEPFVCVYGRTYDSAISVVRGSESTRYQGMSRGEIAELRAQEHQAEPYYAAQDDFSHTITGLAVMASGNYLFVARAKAGVVQVHDKTTGVLVQTLAGLSFPRHLSVSGTTLFMVTAANTVAGYPINDDGTLGSASVSIAGITQPLALNASATEVAVCDGSPERVSRYSAATGQLLSQLGGNGSYTSSPEVANDKFYFVDRNYLDGNTFRTFVAYAPDGSLWVNDAGNQRAQHYSPQNTYLERLMFLPHSYSVVAVRNSPTRVFNEYLEFAIDYSKDLQDGGWELVRNYRGAIPQDYTQDHIAGVFQSAVTLSNGRTYGLLRNTVLNQPVLVEIPTDGPLRITDTFFPASDGSYFTETGEYHRSGGQFVPGGTFQVYKRPLTGFDSSNNPVWGAETVLVPHGPVLGTEPIGTGNLPKGQALANGNIVFFDSEGERGTGAQRRGHGYHLGAMDPATGNFVWQAAPATWRRYNGPFPDKGQFDIGNLGETPYQSGRDNAAYAGGDVLVAENIILWGYHGEGWQDSQTNMWNMYSSEGLFLGQFGALKNPQLPGMAGNVYSCTVVKVNGKLYLYHNDESVRGAVHRWEIGGLDTITRSALPLAAASMPSAASSSLMLGVPPRTSLADGVAGWTRVPAIDTSAAYAVTNYQTLDFLNPDILLRIQGNSSLVVSRDLQSLLPAGTVNGYTLSGILNFLDFAPSTSATNRMDLQVLDDTGKVIVQVTRKLIDYPNNIPLVLNEQPAKVYSLSDWEIIPQSCRFAISVAGAGVTLMYNGSTSAVIPMLDSAANWQKPSALRLRCISATGDTYSLYAAVTAFTVN
jgi:hypothetical protein